MGLQKDGRTKELRTDVNQYTIRILQNILVPILQKYNVLISAVPLLIGITSEIRTDMI